MNARCAQLSLREWNHFVARTAVVAAATVRVNSGAQAQGYIVHQFSTDGAEVP